MITSSDSERSVDLEAQEAYWRNRLGGDVRALQVYLDHPRLPVPGFLSAHMSQELDLHLCHRINSLCDRTNSTLDGFLLAVCVTLLFRYTDQEDFIVRSLSSDSLRRIESRTETFTNPVALYTNLVGDPSFVAFLDRVAQNVREAAMHRDYPFQKIQRDRNIPQANISPIMFVLVGRPTLISAEPITEDHLDDAAEYINQCDLVFLFAPTAESLTVTCQYDAEIFEASTVRRLLDRYETLLQGIVAQPTAKLSQLPLLTELERKQLIIEWNNTQADYPKDKCIHELFEAQVEKTPDAIAVVFEDQQVTYRELNNRANQLAHYLRKYGVGPDVLVGICMERTMEMIVGILGILKAGGAYVPLDPSYPKSRREFILNDSRVSVLLTNSSFGDESGSREGDSPSVNPDPRIKSARLDTDRPAIERESRENLTAQVQPRDIAYVIYTSGSTGTPKGVAIEHRNAGAFLSWVQSAFTQDELSGVLASTSICFDLSVFEIFAPLTSGGTVVVAQNALALATLPKQSTVTLLNTVPSAMNELLNLVAIPESVRVINLAGEPLRTDLVRRIYESSAVAKVHDLYGPSECTTYSTWTDRTPDGPQTIGRPIANTQIYILDGGLNPLPIGVVGEIYIGGDGVARGYLNRPELTAEKFIADPFSEDPGARLYKTGDLARYLPDGNIEFLGRVDHQVKIRGYRIELGEIETVLAQHATIQQAVVLAREDSPGDKRLVAYVVAAPGCALSVNELRGFLQQKLPEYMVPSAFMFLDSLPITPNGKLDRKALPAPEQTRPELDETYCPPRTPVEELLAQIWSDVLKLDHIGIHDNFFHLGGHSLLATQVISRIRDTFKLDLPLRSLFEAPTIDGLAQRVQELREKAVRAGTKITRVAREQYRVK